MVVLRDDPPSYITRYCKPLWSIPRPVDSGAGLFLPGVKTLIYTSYAKRRGWAAGRWRRRRCEQIMGRLAFRDWRFFCGADCDPYWVEIPRDHARLLRANVAPLLILEDDVELCDWRANVLVPEGTELAYLGGFRSGDSRGIRNARLVGLEPLLAWRYGYLPINDDWMRIFGMWGSHAILYLSTDAMRDVADQLARKRRAIDTTLAVLQWRWRCHCLRRPIFWQNDGHHLHDTYEYDWVSGWEPFSRRRARGGKASQGSA